MQVVAPGLTWAHLYMFANVLLYLSLWVLYSPSHPNLQRLLGKINEKKKKCITLQACFVQL